MGAPKDPIKKAEWIKNLSVPNTEKHNLNISKSIRKEKHWNWKGENASYNAKHWWIRTNYEHPLKCEDCGQPGEKINGKWNIEWSNKDHLYKRVREDYKGRCKKCHRKYDKENNLSHYGRRKNKN